MNTDYCFFVDMYGIGAREPYVYCVSDMEASDAIYEWSKSHYNLVVYKFNDPLFG